MGPGPGPGPSTNGVLFNWVTPIRSLLSVQHRPPLVSWVTNWPPQYWGQQLHQLGQSLSTGWVRPITVHNIGWSVNQSLLGWLVRLGLGHCLGSTGLVFTQHGLGQFGSVRHQYHWVIRHWLNSIPPIGSLPGSMGHNWLACQLSIGLSSIPINQWSLSGSACLGLGWVSHHWGLGLAFSVINWVSPITIIGSLSRPPGLSGSIVRQLLGWVGSIIIGSGLGFLRAGSLSGSMANGSLSLGLAQWAGLSGCPIVWVCHSIIGSAWVNVSHPHTGVIMSMGPSNCQYNWACHH